jgi:adenylate kinase
MEKELLSYYMKLKGPSVILFIGPPMSGKGTQSHLLKDMLGLYHISSGDVLRRHIESNPFIKEQMASGGFVNDDIMMPIIESEVEKSPLTNIIFDGLVREMSGIAFLDKLCEKFSMKLDMVIHLDVPDDILFERFRNDNNRVNRPDNTLEIFTKRIEKFHTNTKPLLDFYKQKDILYKIDGSKSPSDVNKQIIMNLMTATKFKIEDLCNTNYKITNYNFYIELLLHLTSYNRYNFNRRIVLINTTNKNKVDEYCEHLCQYGLEVYQLPKASCNILKKIIELKEILAIISDKCYLTRKGKNEKLGLNIKDNTLVCNVCDTFILMKSGFYSYKSIVDGIYNSSKRIDHSFGWDDCFTVRGHTYAEYSIHGVKISARNRNISKWIDEHINTSRQAKHKGDILYGKINMKSDIDFDVYPDNFVRNKFYESSEFAMRIIPNVLNDGLFFRSTQNRRIKNYWCPGINAGIPLTFKSDEIHQYTYMFHDFCHFIIPDLIFTGNHSEKNKKVYIYWRMMSEATSMIMADMLFINDIKDKFDYNFSTRKIYPLFKEFCEKYNWNGKEGPLLKYLLKCNFEFCMTGHSDGFVDLQSYPDYKNKYEPFFIGDIEWTYKNYQNMVKNCDSIRSWYKYINKLSKSLNLLTVEDVSNSLPDDFSYEHIIEYAYHRILQYLSPTILLSKEDQKAKAFERYRLGQLYIFFKYDFIEDSNVYLNKLSNITNVDDFREIYNEYLIVLKDACVLADDDIETYKEIFPLFDPAYINYANFKDKSIKDVVNKIFIEEKHQSLMEKLVINFGGIVDENLFVIKPGVKPITRFSDKHGDSFVTFLIAGISVETSLELISHNEAMISRLTTSNTKAMEKPLYRIIDNSNPKIQKHIIKKNIQLHKFNLSVEVSNMLNPGTKSTALLYTMKINDFKKMFIGRSKLSGNETEVREVVKMIYDELYKYYPEIPDWNWYLNARNFDKKTLVTNGICVNTNTLNEYGLKLAELFGIIISPNEENEWRIYAAIQSKITYFTTKKIITEEELDMYLTKILIEYGHTSILDGWQITGMPLKQIFFKFLL